jgi:translation initiation factor IF-2
MGHVDHGKTSLLDYIREENVIAGESGGITQHIGAYSVTLKGDQKITFLDTPGHEAFTAMRARGAQVTDIAIIVVAADDDIMPQTKEAISHAQAAGVPIIFAINKIDKPNSNPEKIKEALAGMNLMVEDWGGKIQSQDISALKGTGIKELLEKVLLEAEILELKANPNRKSKGTVVEAFLDKGRGYVSTILVQTGTLSVGDYILAGKHSGKIKAMFDERGNALETVPPSSPVSVLGLDGAPQAGDNFNVLEDEKEAKQIAAKRMQLQREQNVRTQRHITLDEIGRRIALGEFKELNLILKGDVDGSVEALTDSLQKLSTEEIHVNIIHKGVGAITESDVLLASASDAIVIGFNVRPMGNARSIADKEEIDIRSYSIIYDAINDVKDAMEGMLSPEMKEEITGTAEIRETYKISKVGTVAGCMVITGKIFRNSGIRIIREGVVVHSGFLSSLKRFKDDAKEVAKGYDCGLQVKNYNEIQEGDTLECFQEVAVKKKL